MARHHVPPAPAQAYPELRHEAHNQQKYKRSLSVFRTRLHTALLALLVLIGPKPKPSRACAASGLEAEASTDAACLSPRDHNALYFCCPKGLAMGPQNPRQSLSARSTLTSGARKESARAL